jgi:polyhydroxyalkanoate synthesis repressor PhaR
MRVIKRYSNRKLYDTTTRTYVTLEHVAEMVADSVEIKVVDNDTDEDLTTVILSQILLERERSKRSLPTTLLSGLLRSGETLGRNLSGTLKRPTETSRAGLLGFLEGEIERSLKFWTDLGLGSEEEVLRLLDNIIEKRRRARPPRRHDAPDDGYSEHAENIPLQNEPLQIFELHLAPNEERRFESLAGENTVYIVSGAIHLYGGENPVELTAHARYTLPPGAAAHFRATEETTLLLITLIP